MKKVYVFPGQGAQFIGMGKNLYDQNEQVKAMFNEANEILGFNIVDIMFNGTEADLKQTNVTQPAIFLHSIAAYKTIENPEPAMVAGHSLGEFSALVANEVLPFAEALELVSIRANAMHKACEAKPGIMAAVLNLPDAKVEEICQTVSAEIKEIVIAANYNCPGQLVISGSINAIHHACEAMKAAGAKRALVLPVGGAFHSPLMQPAQEELATAIQKAHFKNPVCPVYQNVVAAPITDPNTIKNNLIAQLTGAVKWTQTIEAMIADGATEFIECGPGKVLQGLVQKIAPGSITTGLQ